MPFIPLPSDDKPRPEWLQMYTNPPKPSPQSKSLPDPPGFTRVSNERGKSKDKSSVEKARKAPTPEEMDKLKLKKAWEVALAPAKQLPMNAIGMAQPPDYEENLIDMRSNDMND
jgi:ER membrane protein complex subunit 4